jgi:F0F1-type ATP synthase assembly protein I
VEVTRAGDREAAAHRRGAWRGVDESNVMGVELLAATLTWAGIGWLLDRWLGTGPWLLGAGAVVGNAAGLYLIWLRGARMDRAEAARLRAARLGRTADPVADAEPDVGT